MGARDDILAIPDELLRNGRVSEASLVFMDFKDNPRRWWTGFGDLVTAGQTWLGTGNLINISEVVTSYAATAQPMTFQLAATDEMLDATEDAEDQVYGRQCIVYGQLFTTQGEGLEPSWVPIGAPFAHFSGTMEKLRYRQAGLTEASIELVAEGLFYRRTAPPRGMITDVDQKARNPGDKGAEYVAKYTDYETLWLG